jgi:hypothetical protein
VDLRRLLAQAEIRAVTERLQRLLLVKTTPALL